MKGTTSPTKNNRGSILPVALLFLMLLVIAGTTATIVTTTDLKIGSNLKSSGQAVYVAEAGLEEARGRLKASAADPISDGHPGQTQWGVFIGAEGKAQGKGYDNGNAMHTRKNSLQTGLDYSISISHQTDSAGNILYYGDADGDGMAERNTTTGENVYLVSSTGYASGSESTVETEISRQPPITVPGALYVESWTIIQGSVDIDGNDSCGTGDKPGIASSQPSGTVTLHGSPVIDGVGAADPNISYDMPHLNVQGMVDGFKAFADFTYTVESPTHTAATSPGPGDGWGTPTPGDTPQDPSSCDVNNIVHYDTLETDIRLSSVSGCGILLVEGDLEVAGSFNWYGVVMATGSIIFTGGGNRNITGAIVSGGSVLGDIIGGNVNLVYCSSAISDQTAGKSLKVLSWKENI